MGFLTHVVPVVLYCLACSAEDDAFLAVLSLRVDGIQSGMDLKSLLQRQGFIFYKLDEEGHKQ